MSVEQMRDAISWVIPNEKWKYKVSKMADDQVMAIYFKFKQEGRFGTKRYYGEPVTEQPEAVQMTIYDFI